MAVPNPGLLLRGDGAESPDPFRNVDGGGGDVGEPDIDRAVAVRPGVEDDPCFE